MNRWITLLLIMLVYLPVSLDATILHIAMPVLSKEFNLSTTALLWVMDIYSLIMVALILPMGILGDRIGFKSLILWGTATFGLASFLISFSQSGIALICGRAFLGVGAAMIIPATLAGVRHIFKIEKERNFAFGLWSTIGGGAAAVGPLLGGFLLQYYHWTSIFLLNIPFAVLAFFSILFYIPQQEKNLEKTVNWLQTITLIVAILFMMYGFKSIFYDFSIINSLIALSGLITFYFFIRQQKKALHPILDLALFKNKQLNLCLVIIVVAMIALVGFELLVAQELQFVYHFQPIAAGLFSLPLILAASVGGLISSFILNRFGFKFTMTLGLGFTGLILYVLGVISFIEQKNLTILCMVGLGLSIEMALLSATSQVMTSVDESQASRAGALEGVAYELGSALGIAIFGVLLSIFYQHHVVFPQYIQGQTAMKMQQSLGEALQVIPSLPIHQQEALFHSVTEAFLKSHSAVLSISAFLFLLLAILVWFKSAKKMPNS